MPYKPENIAEFFKGSMISPRPITQLGLLYRKKGISEPREMATS
ncbi:MAG: hypothetical protein NZ853_11140 [Leptospiraceae bacterium]|nr:hypothetical protein [Leptospiraceae bacterium]